MNASFQRGMLLFRQGRTELAEAEFRRALAEEPGDGRAHAYLALCLLEKQDFRAAHTEAAEAIRLGPDDDFPHQVMANICYRRNRLEEATAHIMDAIAIHPYNPDHQALLSAIRLEQRNWPGALEAAEAGLAIDPEDPQCANFRAIALVRLGRRSEAGATIDAALARNPEDPVSHANQGWTLLHAGQPDKAMEHFREALRLDPTSEWARQGIVESLKARNFIYRAMLMYFLWMARLSSQAQWMIVIGGFVASRLLLNAADRNPNLWFLKLIFWAYVAFALMTWLAVPMFNLMLRLNKFGRLALSREQTVQSNWVGGLLGGALACAIAGLAMGSGLLLDAAVLFGLLMLPLSGVFNCPAGWPRRTMIAVVAALAVFAGGLVTLVALQNPWEWNIDRLVGTYGYSILFSALGAQALAVVRVRR